MKDSDLEGDNPKALGLSMRKREVLLAEMSELQMELVWLTLHTLRELAGRYGLQPPQMMVLHLLDGRHSRLALPHEGSVSMSDLSRSMDMPPATATAMVDRLTGQGLVERGPGEQDRRTVMVRMTERGKAVLKEVDQLWQRVQHDALAVLSEEQLSMYLDLMKRLQQGYLQGPSDDISIQPSRSPREESS